jgi:hypothetical protein
MRGEPLDNQRLGRVIGLSDQIEFSLAFERYAAPRSPLLKS